MVGCSYGVHPTCATRKDIWDGKELEGTSEDLYEDVESYKEISAGIIQHFIHQNHHMRLDEETDRAFDENKRCQACALPIFNDIIYHCMQCDNFVLHQTCANQPRKKQHATHPHSLSLRVDHEKGWFKCTACEQEADPESGLYMCNVCNVTLHINCVLGDIIL
ncbi:unnamed protein product [Thlaspi arvense]|uniref:DC1 domain-containing protein n=1 Tax=Thlaspi arvense TaxID=13288 RepID=A0AAU9RVC9_THLAR|nr:unnamed protein product [Thlaspi arvense]